MNGRRGSERGSGQRDSGQRDSGRRPEAVQLPRRVAFDVIRAVHESEAYANLLLPVRLRRNRLSGPDAALATELTYGTLRQTGYYDRVIELAAGRDLDRIDPPILDVLRLSVHQLLSMRVASHAAVNEAVSLARSVASQSAAGFVNGVLRTVARSTPEEWRERAVGTARSDDERLSLESSHPVWILRAFRRALAREGREHELDALLAADNVAPSVTLAALPGVAAPDAVPGRPTAYSPFGVHLEGGDPGDLPAVSRGEVRVQDEGSQLAALALSRVRDVRPGERWLDLCAGPGGKTALLAAEAALGGATVTANEVVPARAELVRSALVAVPGETVVWERDGREVGATDPESFDRILLDAPCTGLGALRRRPEARWRKSPRDVAGLTPLQAELLESAIRALAPGGVLAYVTCSPHLAETRAVVADALRRHPELEALDTAAVLAGVTREPLDLPGDDTSVQLWPHRHGTDAMFIALIAKPASVG
jgi:16S rRNA (cytosine967-C5)-methyltransferase